MLRLNPASGTVLQVPKLSSGTLSLGGHAWPVRDCRAEPTRGQLEHTQGHALCHTEYYRIYRLKKRELDGMIGIAHHGGVAPLYPSLPTSSPTASPETFNSR